MNIEDIFGKRDVEKRTLTIAPNEKCVVLLESKPWEISLREYAMYFRDYKVIVKK